MMPRHDHLLVIVFGAGGRLGQALLPLLASGPWDVAAVSRRRTPSAAPAAVRWIQGDLADADCREGSLRALCVMAESHGQVIIMDLVLDRASVAAMRASLAAATGYITLLRRHLAAVGRPASLVLASTTAVLAPWPYQTPYGRAKRRQLSRYAAAGMTGQALLLPQLMHGEPAVGTASARLAWTYAQAAACLLGGVRASTPTTATRLQLLAPQGSRLAGRDTGGIRAAAWLRVAGRVLVLQALAWTSRRNSPLAHRLASRARLDLTPGRLRCRVDHHLVPGRLVRSLSRELGTTPGEFTAWG